MTPDDAARLAEIRETHDDPESDPDCDECFLLRLLDARPQGEFVTRAKYERDSRTWCDLAAKHAERAIVAEAERDRLAAALAAAEARNLALQQALLDVLNNTAVKDVRDFAVRDRARAVLAVMP